MIRVFLSPRNINVLSIGIKTSKWEIMVICFIVGFWTSSLHDKAVTSWKVAFLLLWSYIIYTNDWVPHSERKWCIVCLMCKTNYSLHYVVFLCRNCVCFPQPTLHWMHMGKSKMKRFSHSIDVWSLGVQMFMKIGMGGRHSHSVKGTWTDHHQISKSLYKQIILVILICINFWTYDLIAANEYTTH